VSPYDPSKHHRRSVRLPHHNYGEAGWYAVTFCTHLHEPVLGDCSDGVVVLSPTGRAVHAMLCTSANPGLPVFVDAFVVMPNHVHCIVVIRTTSPELDRGSSDLRSAPPGSLGAFMASLKSRAARRINVLRGTPGAPVWQRSYWDRVIRGEAELVRFRDYIAINPSKWSEDRYNH